MHDENPLALFRDFTLEDNVTIIGSKARALVPAGRRRTTATLAQSRYAEQGRGQFRAWSEVPVAILPPPGREYFLNQLIL